MSQITYVPHYLYNLKDLKYLSAEWRLLLKITMWIPVFKNEDMRSPYPAFSFYLFRYPLSFSHTWSGL